MGSKGIDSAELEFRFGPLSAPGHMGAAGLKLQLSTCEAWLWWGGGRPCGGGCKFGGLGFAGVVLPWSLLFYKSQPTKPEAPPGIRFPELEFWFWARRAPGRMGQHF